VGEGVHLGRGRQRQAVQRVDPGRREQHLTERYAEVGGRVQRDPGCREQDVAGERVAVGVQPARGHRDQGIAGTHPVRAEHSIGTHHPGRRSGDVIVVRAEQAGMLRSLAADQRAAGERAARIDAGHDVGDPLRHDLAAGDVVGHEQRLGAADHDVVDDHPDQVVADRVVTVHRLRDRDLGADAVGRGREQPGVVDPEQPGEAAEPADDLGPGRGEPALDQLDRRVTGLDRDPGGRVGRAALGSRWGHGRCSASAAPTPGSNRS
jgi:hypothetical protein